MAKVMAFGPYVQLLGEVVQAGKAKFSGVDSWGAIGLCWGGKVAVLQSGSGSVFKVTAQVHPGWVGSNPFLIMIDCFTSPFFAILACPFLSLHIKADFINHFVS
jgi:hypothetical protein